MDAAQLLIQALAELAQVREHTHDRDAVARLERAIALINEAHHALTT